MSGVNFGSSSNVYEGSAANGEYQDMGVGNNTEAYREATLKGRFPADNTGPNRSQGEVPGAGSIFSALLNERPNLSNPRNRGPERAPSRVGAKPIPIVAMGSRATGRIGGGELVQLGTKGRRRCSFRRKTQTGTRSSTRMESPSWSRYRACASSRIA